MFNAMIWDLVNLIPIIRYLINNLEVICFNLFIFFMKIIIVIGKMDEIFKW